MNEATKLTKAAVRNFLRWSTTRYNDYLGFGTKKQNVDTVFTALQHGNYKGESVFAVECASPVGESGPTGAKHHGKYWRTKQAGEKYVVDCEERTITATYRNEKIRFH